VAGKCIKQRGMKEAPEKVKELLHSAHGNGLNKNLSHC
jgi:hypothetical protein